MRNDLLDPYLVLGIDETAGDAQVREAYLAGVRRHPPEQSPDGFASIASAYDQIRTEAKRLRHRFVGPFPYRWEEAEAMFPRDEAPNLPTRREWMEEGIRMRAGQAADRAGQENGDWP